MTSPDVSTTLDKIDILCRFAWYGNWNGLLPILIQQSLA